MPTVEVEFSEIAVVGANTTLPGSIVGDDPWGDDSDDTYTADTQSLRTTRTVDWIVATIPPIPEAMTVTSAAVAFRASAENIGGAVGMMLGLVVMDADFNTHGIFEGDTGIGFDYAFTVTGSPADYSAGLVGGMDITSVIQSGGYLVQRRLGSNSSAGETSPADYIGRIHKLTLLLTYTVPGIPPCRVIRDDEYAGISRVVRGASRQASNRVVGYY